MKFKKITSVGCGQYIEITEDIELEFHSDFVGIVDIRVNVGKPTLIILSKERTMFLPHDYWCFYNRRNIGKTCFCVSPEDLREGDILRLEFINNNCLMSIINAILPHTMD